MDNLIDTFIKNFNGTNSSFDKAFKKWRYIFLHGYKYDHS